MSYINAIKLAYEIIKEIYPDDNEIEERIEEWLKNKIGIDIDLTPRSPENNDNKKG